jgi:CelD/BcsL family acetyltransferase involved in cellulose biosynthesis
MQREGEAEVRHYSNPQGEDLRAMLEACGVIERKSWLATSKSGQPRYMSKESVQFWEHVCQKQLGPQGQLDAWLVYFNKQPIAFRFTLTAGTTRYLIANQYDEEFAQYRAGWILYLRDLENCAERGIQAIDMGSGDAHYKSRWGGVEGAEGVDFLILPPGPVGVLAARLMSLEPLYERARKKLMS